MSKTDLEGKLWSLIRNVLGQGQAQQQDYAAGKYPRGYEEFSAHVDMAARERVPEFLALLQQAQGWRPISEYNDEWPIEIRAPELVDLDFNPPGETEACALNGDEWVAAKWCNHQDYFKTIPVKPTHFRVKR